jgi:hypothetical protein
MEFAVENVHQVAANLGQSRTLYAILKPRTYIAVCNHT